ncbi:hypothetical protein E2562_024763 [Oryza meyeriana var. granulata]|uniref:Receptor kinase-like protein Xa21 n=1 Tax=Oryza meyeriana var. granulata TaxID=110450 RepID=A0A6G1FBZ2_9ORYZ|nr:hypothetical protein E2562_024763 [Oryza meyeriana var. granulata]KAF0934303.1 hypothetical protein E2562_024763 [Oryza meyeriana var. granulata]
MIILLALLFLGTSKIYCATLPENSTDVLSLQGFKREITYDPTRVLNSWNSSTYHCFWEGVKCSPTHPGRVIALELPDLMLAGQISPSIGNLTFLKTLNLSGNSFSGLLPPLGNLDRLQILDLNKNSLHDIIPDAIMNCSKLKAIDLSGNSLVGEIPARISVLSNLSLLRLSYNNLTGIIPPALGNITYIAKIALASNMLKGPIPNELGKLSNISSLLLGDNNLSGEVPKALYNLSSLRYLALEINNLGNTVPHNIGDILPNLKWLFLNQNMFQGEVPNSLGNISGLERLELENNNFAGQIPRSFGKLPNLTYLNLEGNRLEASDSQSWEFFSALTNCSDLQVLSLSQNQLYGAIPDSVGNFSASLQSLRMSKNRLSGILPPSLGKLTSLYVLSLGYNNLSGTVDEWIGKLTELQGLFLNSNNFTGPIPFSIGNLTKLTKFNISHNEFEGPIPPSLGKFVSVSYFDISYNNIYGEIPQELSNLKQLTEIHLSSNNLTGEIPSTLDQCTNLVTIQMDQNFLIGNIPESLGNIKSLSMLNLSRNNLTGEIPITLSGIQFSKLDLSYNQLQGKIPRIGIFENATAVSLEGNLGLCGGAMDFHMPSCTAASKKVEKQYYLITILIPIFGFMSLILLVYFLLTVKKMPRSKYSESHSFGENFPKVSYKDLAQATMNFSESNLVGRGSYGTVYRGKLKETKVEVAVKVFDLDMQGAEKSFLSECEALRSIQHRNLLPIITACSTVDINGSVFKALIYAYMPNGNLDTWLHKKGDGKAPKYLGLTQRVNIAVNIADALDYLHFDCGRPTVHCDLKPSNILLGDDMTALLGDFGIAKFYVDTLRTTTASTSSIGMRGTIGYIAPEYANGGHISTSGDVYSFGIVLLEVMTGKRPTDPMFKDGLNIVNFVESNIPHQLLDVIDSNLTEECKDLLPPENVHPESAVYQCLLSLFQVALSCTRPLPSERMNMKEIAGRMQAIKSSYEGWKTRK